MSLENKLNGIVARYRDIAGILSAGGVEPQNYARLAKEYAELGPVVERIEALQRANKEMVDLAALLADPAVDPEVKTLAEEEHRALKASLPSLEREVQRLLLPRDEADERNAILEVRAGTGGEEAALFAADLFRMYQRYADLHGWKVEIMELSETGLRGLK